MTCSTPGSCGGRLSRQEGQQRQQQAADPDSELFQNNLLFSKSHYLLSVIIRLLLAFAKGFPAVPFFYGAGNFIAGGEIVCQFFK